MALDQSALLEVLEALKAADVEDRIRQAAGTIYQALIDAELTAVIGAGPHERTPRRGSRSATGTGRGCCRRRPGIWSCGSRSCGPGRSSRRLLERRRRVDQALFAVVMEAYLHGVSTRKVDDLVKALGADTGISKSEVCRICADLDAEVGAFRDRQLAGAAFPYVFLDATYCKARVNRRVVSQAVVVATGVRADGWREVLGFAVGDSEDGAFWTAFLRSLKARGLGGVQLVISDAHTGLKQAIAAVLLGAAWQRCRVHFLRNVLAQVPKGNAEMVAAAIRTDLRPTRRRATSATSSTSSPGCSAGSSPRSRPCCGTPPTTCSPSPASRPALEEDLVHQPAGAAEQGDQTPHRRRRRLPQPRRPAPPRRRRPGRSPRRMADRRPPLPLRRLHGPARRTTAPARRWRNRELIPA